MKEQQQPINQAFEFLHFPLSVDGVKMSRTEYAAHCLNQASFFEEELMSLEGKQDRENFPEETNTPLALIPEEETDKIVAEIESEVEQMSEQEITEELEKDPEGENWYSQMCENLVKHYTEEFHKTVGYLRIPEILEKAKDRIHRDIQMAMMHSFGAPNIGPTKIFIDIINGYRSEDIKKIMEEMFEEIAHEEHLEGVTE
jgi:hypothetical protein